MNISLDWYKIFCEVSKKKNITVAAENLCISQPAVSQTIKQLEESLNAELFLRTKKGVTLTKEGEVLYSYVLEAIEVCKIEDIFVCGEKYKDLSKQKVSLRELEKYPLICLEEHTSTRKYIDKKFKENNIECNPKYELATSNLIVDFAKRNFGIGAVVDKFAEEKINNKEIYKLDIKEKIEPRNICIIKKDKLISKASNELLKFIINK